MLCSHFGLVSRCVLYVFRVGFDCGLCLFLCWVFHILCLNFGLFFVGGVFVMLCLYLCFVFGTYVCMLGGFGQLCVLCGC